jgi:hypothetical protein
MAVQGQFNRALAIAIEIELKDFKDFALSDICVLLHEKGEVKKAHRLLRKIDDGSIKELLK